MGLTKCHSDIPDRYIAEGMLNRLKFVGFEEFEQGVQQGINDITSSIKKMDGSSTSIAVFPVSRNPEHFHNKNKEFKPANDSAGRIAHSLKNLERHYAGKIEVSPRISSMKAQKIKHIIYVDDVFGSGKRLVKFWRESVPGAVKAWVSKGWCTIWLFAYAAHEQGIQRISKELKGVDIDRIKCQIKFDRSENLLKREPIRNILEKYSYRTKKHNVMFGYGALWSPIIFQHGCPNNTPAILWASGKPFIRNIECDNSDRWNALFPERGIPTELYPLFSTDTTLERTADTLWEAGQYKLALNLIDSLDDPNPKNGKRSKLILFILGMLNQNHGLDRIRSILLLSDHDFDLEIGNLINSGLVDNDLKLTKFGVDYLDRVRKQVNTKNFDYKYEVFYPSTFLGLQRDI
jgi:hypothetical protein